MRKMGIIACSIVHDSFVVDLKCSQSVMSRAHYEQLTLSLEIDIDPCHDDGSVTAIRSVTCQLLDCYSIVIV